MTGEMIGIYVLISIAILTVIMVAVIVLLRRKQGGISAQELRCENEELKNALNVAIANSVENTVKLENAILASVVSQQAESIKLLSAKLDSLVQNVNDRIDMLKSALIQNGGELKQSNAELKAELVKSDGELKAALMQSDGELKLALVQSLSEIKENLASSIALLKDSNTAAIKELSEKNVAQLEKMRMTVDEKLDSTLEQRFNQSFKLVSERLEQINRTFGELQSLQTGVNDLNKIFKNVKARGTWGEIALENLLSQILVPEQYDKQVRLTRGSDDAVDFVIKLPGKGDGEVYLPIDSKFPIEDYTRLAEASESADAQAVDAASKALAARIKQEAMSIRDKYVKPPKTTDFAIMYLPTEGLYAEIIRREGLVEELQNRYRIVVCGPTTIAALLNSLQMGFQSIAMEKRSTEIAKLLKSFSVDFDKFTVLLRQTGDKLGKVQASLVNAENRTEQIRKKLDKVSVLSGDGTPAHELLERGLETEIDFAAGDIDDEN